MQQKINALSSFKYRQHTSFILWDAKNIFKLLVRKKKCNKLMQKFAMVLLGCTKPVERHSLISLYFNHVCLFVCTGVRSQMLLLPDSRSCICRSIHMPQPLLRPVKLSNYSLEKKIATNWCKNLQWYTFRLHKTCWQAQPHKPEVSFV